MNNDELRNSASEAAQLFIGAVKTDIKRNSVYLESTNKFIIDGYSQHGAFQI